MNIYTSLNEIINYIEQNLENEIDYKKIAQILGTNEYTLKRIFPLLTNISISEYIRNRRLSNAGFDLYKTESKIIDIAVKYQYESATAFSRAFEKFHGIKPSMVKTNPEKLRVFSKIQFKENLNENSNIEYSIIEMNEMTLYGKCIKTDLANIGKVAPEFCDNFNKEYEEKYGHFDYAATIYESRFDSQQCEYWISYINKIDGFTPIIIPKSKWLKFKINSTIGNDIQNVVKIFYEKFLPSTKYKIKPIPELEYYHENTAELLIPIED